MKFVNQIKEGVKTIAWVIILVLFLKVTGLLSSVTFLAQSAVLKTGLVNAATSVREDREAFNYDFVVKDMEGKKISFDQYKGKVIFVNLWATWCGPCRAEMAGIQKLYDKVDHTKIQFVMLSIDREEHKNKVTKYLSDFSFTFPAFTPSGYLPDQLRVPSIPTTFVVSKDGKIVTKEVGTTNFNTNKFKKFLEGLTAQ
jgi:thiol-disulfide isomerase/thioredoxin